MIGQRSTRLAMRPAGRRWCRRQSNDFGAQFQHAALLFVTLDDLHALAGLPQAPVFFLAFGKYSSAR
jgi:hypothetical protein